MSTPITQHFSLNEFACHDGTPYPTEWIADRLKPLCDTLEAIREAGGYVSITINSGFRTPDYQQRLWEKSAKDGTVAPGDTSEHPEGRASDIVHATLSPLQLFNLILRLFEQGKLPHLGGVGLYPTFVHVDIKPRAGDDGSSPTAGHLRIWGGKRPSNVL